MRKKEIDHIERNGKKVKIIKYEGTENWVIES